MQSGQYAKWRTGKWEQHALTPKGELSKRVERTLSVNLGYKTAWDLEKLEPKPFPSGVLRRFRQRVGVDGGAEPLAGAVEQWVGQTGSDNVRRVVSNITDTSVDRESPYADYSRNGATIFPRCLFFVNETENPALIQAADTITVNPRRGPYDKDPWKRLDLTAISQQTVESRHLYDVHLGETVVPYATLYPLKALLPVRQGEYEIPTDVDGPGGIRLGGLDQRMRGRWQTISQMWENNKTVGSKLDLLGNLNYQGKLYSQLNRRAKILRVVYTGSGEPTAAVIPNGKDLVDYTLFWIHCNEIKEADYLLAIINSNALYEAVQPLMPKGQFGARHLQKHLWKLPIPEFDTGDSLHQAVAEAGAAAALGVSERLAELRRDRREKLTVTIARKELRNWLRNSDAGTAVEVAVKRLLSGG